MRRFLRQRGTKVWRTRQAAAAGIVVQKKAAQGRGAAFVMV